MLNIYSVAYSAELVQVIHLAVSPSMSTGFKTLGYMYQPVLQGLDTQTKYLVHKYAIGINTRKLSDLFTGHYLTEMRYIAIWIIKFLAGAPC